MDDIGNWIGDNLGGLALFALVIWILFRQRNSDAAALLAGALERITKLENRVRSLEAQNRKHTAVLQVHATWDARATAAMTPEQAAALGPPPPLYPPEEEA